MKYFINLILVCVLICATCFTSCKDEESGEAKVQSVTPTQSTVYILEGSTATIAATVAPNEADQEITWTNENSNIATVVDRGRIDGISASSVTGVSLGSTTVTATSVSDPGKKAMIQVIVTKHIDSVTVDIDRVTFILGDMETATAEAAVIPASAIQEITWTSSNPNVATVSNGVIKAAGVGTAIITATSTGDPTKKATIEVEVISLVNKDIHIASKYGNGLTVSWVKLGGDLVEFFYTNDAGQQASTIVPVTTQSSYIPDFGSTPLSYRTLYFTQGTIRDTVRAPLVNFTGAIYDFTQYIKSSPAENIISAFDFDLGGEGIGFHDADGNNSLVNYRRDRGDSRSDAVYLETGGNIGYMHNNAWYNYTIVVLDAGNYEIDWRVSVNGSGAKCRIEVDGVASAEYPMNNNSNWTDWRYYCNFYNIEPPKFYLTAGKHVIRFCSMSASYNYIGLRLTYKD
jgi:uncharacterized protein YjdB